MTNPLAAFLTALQSDPTLKARLRDTLPENGDDVPARIKAFASAEGHTVSDADLAGLAGALERRIGTDGDTRVLDDHEVDAVSGGVLGPMGYGIDTIIRNVLGKKGPPEENKRFLDISRREFWLAF